MRLRPGLWISVVLLAVLVLFCVILSILLLFGAVVVLFANHSFEGFIILGFFSLLLGVSGSGWFASLETLIDWIQFTR